MLLGSVISPAVYVWPSYGMICRFSFLELSPDERSVVYHHYSYATMHKWTHIIGQRGIEVLKIHSRVRLLMSFFSLGNMGNIFWLWNLHIKKEVFSSVLVWFLFILPPRCMIPSLIELYHLVLTGNQCCIVLVGLSWLTAHTEVFHKEYWDVCLLTLPTISKISIIQIFRLSPF